MGNNPTPDRRRGELGFIIAIILGLLLGMAIKRVRIGLLLGLALGLVIVFLGARPGSRRND